jgi:hypothetical protein
MELRARLKRSYPETGDRRERLLSQRGRRVLKEGVKSTLIGSYFLSASSVLLRFDFTQFREDF